jgi:exonuclease SbcD
MKALLVGDCHIKDNEHLDDVQRCLLFAVDVARSRGVDVVLFGGDLFDAKSSPAERIVLRDVLLSFEIPVVMVRGNHEPLGDLAVFSGYPDVTVAERPEILEVGNCDVLCLPWPEKAHLGALGLTGEAGDQAGGRALGAMLAGMNATRRDPSRPLVVVGHISVGGAVSSSGQPLIGRGLEATLGDLTDLGAAFVALSHIHKPQELAPDVEYVGSIRCVDFGEQDETKRVGLLEVGDGGLASVEWVRTPCRRWQTIRAWVEAGIVVEDDPEFCGQVDPDNYAYANLRYSYQCDESEQHLFDHAAIERRFAAAHTLKIVPQVTRAERVRAAEVAVAAATADQLRAWGAATGTEVTTNHIDKLQQLESEAV